MSSACPPGPSTNQDPNAEPQGTKSGVVDALSTIQEPDEPDDAEREATELSTYIVPRSTGSTANTAPKSRFGRFWRHNVSLAVPHDECRDHLANERTFLSYLRTSLALSMIGIVTAQLFRIELVNYPSTGRLDYYNLGIPLGATFQGAAMVYVVIGCHRYLRQQLSMARGKVWASGWELYVVGGGTLLFLITLLVLVIGADLVA